MRNLLLLVARCLLAGVPLLTTPVCAQQQDPPPTVAVHELPGSLHRLELNEQTNIVVSAGEDGVLLVDTGYERTAGVVAEALARLDARPVKLIVNTHGDGDHVGGNASLGSEAVILAHSAARALMSSYFALPPRDLRGLPSVTLEKPVTIHFNGESIHLLPVPGGHTPADLVVHFAGSGVVCLGDLLLSASLPSSDPRRGGDPQLLARILRDLMQTLPTDVAFVAGHGPAIDRQQLGVYVELIEKSVAAVRAEVMAGASLDEILEHRPLEPWSSLERPGFPTIEDWTRAVHASLTGTTRPSVCAPVTEVLVKQGAEAAVSEYRRLRRTAGNEYDFGENQLNLLGYQLLGRGRLAEAIAILELNVEMFPDAFNTHDSLGEAYLAAGQRERAIAAYRRSVELNPANANGLDALRRLEEE